MKISIIGCGALGSALALNYSSNKKYVSVWNRKKLIKQQLLEKNYTIKQKRLFKTSLEFLDIKYSIEDVVKDTDVVLICIKAQSVHELFKNYYSVLFKYPIVFCSKGIDTKNLLFQTEIGKKYIKNKSFAVLTGPGFATDILKNKPIALTLACEDKELGNVLQNLLSTPSIRPYLSSDVIGAQVGGSIKNVIAIACGIADAKNLGDSARVAVMTRGFKEIRKIGLALGCKPETLLGLSGLGDLTLTCNSMLSRNYNYGKNLVLEMKNSRKDFITIEGKETADAVCQIADKFGLNIPIIRSVNSVIKRNISIDSAINSLLSRPLKEEAKD